MSSEHSSVVKQRVRSNSNNNGNNNNNNNNNNNVSSQDTPIAVSHDKHDRKAVPPATSAMTTSADPRPVPLKQSNTVTTSTTIETDPTTNSTIKVIHHHHKVHQRKKGNTLIFLLGGLFGLIAAGFFARRTDLIDLTGLSEFNMDSILDVLPAGIVTDMQDVVKGQKEFFDTYEGFSVGMKAKQDGLSAHHPVIMIPGVISTGLESWGTSNITRQYFRKRLWGSWSMMRALVLDKENWKNHIMLDKYTGLDPPGGIKLRAAQGFDATDFFITGYWIWNKIIENLACLGYDTTNSFTAAYDWRLSYADLEVRDHYFSRLKNFIEIANAGSGKKAVLTSHSMGSQVLFYFFHWVASPLGGNAGDDWVDKHIEAWINISGSMLGAVKDVTAILSGEMRDTAQLNAFAVQGLEKFLSREERAQIFRRMPGISSMLPIGGEAVWGNLTWAPDDLPNQGFSFGSLLNFRPQVTANSSCPLHNMTVNQAMTYIFETTQPWYKDMVQRSYSQGVARTAKEVAENEKIPRKWNNPLETRLPLAPNLKIFCFYGFGKPTERAYYYRQPVSPLSQLNVTIDTAHTQNEVDRGVILGEGDGTVNLISMGYMCNKGWKMKRYNPAGVKVTVFEMPHEPGKFNMRGGPNTADHVDILGRQNLNEMILAIASGHGDEIQEYVASRIKEYSERVKVYDD